MMTSQNVFQTLTSPGTAALQVVRLTGPGVMDFLARRFSRAMSSGRRSTGFSHGELRDDSGVIDDPIVVLNDAEKSNGSAGNMSAEISLHGGKAIEDAVVRLLRADGFVMSSNDQQQHSIDEKVARDLPLARTRLALECLLNQPKAWANSENVDANDQALRRLLHPPTVAIVGVPNAGKSSLANQLFARQRTITADMPGTTRDYVSDLADIDGLVIRLLDTPGLRETDDAIERRAIELAQPVIASADLVIELLDATTSLEEQRQVIGQTSDQIIGQTIRITPTPRVSDIVVVNKADLMPSNASIEFQLVSALQGTGIDDLRRIIFRRLLGEAFSPSRAYVW